MPFAVVPEAERNEARLLITMPRDLRREAEQVAEVKGVSLSELGRQALRLYFDGVEHKGTGKEGPG